MPEPRTHELKLHRHPLLVLRLFSLEAFDFLVGATRYLSRHPAVLFLVLFVLPLHLFMTRFMASLLFHELERLFFFALWWLGLGVLSSIGLGTGLHTGMLFLFPHFLQVTLASHACGNLLFSATHDVWFASGPTLFHCEAPTPGAGAVPFVSLLLKALPPALLWGAGTAMGEIPPYWLSRAARRSGTVLEEYEEQREADAHSRSVVARMHNWMISFLQRWGFVGVVLMSAWPNAAFDMCGMACGAFGMGFWTFFLGTLLGKGVIKVIGQTAFFVFIFSSGDANIEALVAFVERIIPDRFEPCRLLLGGKDCHDLLHALLLRVRDSFRSGEAAEAAAKSGGGSWLGTLWMGVIVSFTLYFVVGIIESAAQHRHAATKKQ